MCALAAILSAALASAGDAATLAARDGRLAEFSGGVTEQNGTLTAVGERIGTDTEAFAATYSGSGGGGAASGSFRVDWTQGETVSYGAAFLLPPEFHTATIGQLALLRWDSFPGTAGHFQQGGVVIDYADDLAYLVAGSGTGAEVAGRVLAGPFALPIGRWFKLQVRQRLGSNPSASSQVYVNGELVASSRAANFSGTKVNHVRYGIVQLSGGAQDGPVSLEFDEATASASGGYVNPFKGDSYRTERTDMGVDFCLTPGEPIRAVGDGVVVGVRSNWFDGEPYVWYRLLDGPDAGKYVYVAEQIDRLAHVGETVTAGQPIAYFNSWGTCIETGWSAVNGSTLAQATTGYSEGQVTRAGVSFARFLISLGVHGPFELTPSP